MEYEKFNAGAWHALCKFILAQYGEPHSIYGRVYRDNTVEIRDRNAYGGVDGVEIIRVENRNPVVMYSAPETYNRCIRMHGEFSYVKGHIVALVRKAMGEWPPPA